MKARNSLVVMFICVLLVLAVAVGCSKKANDAQIIGEVTQKIQSDSNIQTKTIAVQSADGVVTLTGTVASDMERSAAANDAGQVAGVRTVLNNLTVEQAATPAPVELGAAMVAKPMPEKKAATKHWSAPKSSASKSSNDYAPPSLPAETTPAPVATAPAAPPRPTTVTIPDGTEISIRLIDPLDSGKNQVGDSFRATVNHAITVDSRTAIPSGADIMGRVIDVKDAAHFSGSSVLAVELVSVAVGGKSYDLHTTEYRKQGAGRGKNTAAKVGGGAAVGAIIGAIAGGGKGAAIGSVVGAGAGTGVQAVTKGQQVQLPAESVLSFQLSGPLTVTPSSGRSGRPVLGDRSASESE